MVERLMILQQTYIHRFNGYQNYAVIRKRLKELYERAFEGDNSFFRVAVDEAVCNAARYAVDEITNVEVTIQTVITPETDIKVRIASVTQAFDALAHREKLMHLAYEPDNKGRDFGDVFLASTVSRGFWMMMTAVDYLIVEADGSAVTLSVSLPYKQDKKKKPTTRMDILVNRFLVRRDGVII